MARSREFEPNEALNKAMYIFWQKGFTETSMEDLVQATGVSRYGFYTTFGDKNELFIKTLEHYATNIINSMLAPLEQANASIEQIRAYFQTLLTQAQSTQAMAGCLIGNTAMEVGLLTKPITAIIDQHFSRMRAAFHNALAHAVETGALRPELDPNLYADYLVGLAMGYLVQLRSGISFTALQNFLQVGLAFLN